MIDKTIIEYAEKNGITFLIAILAISFVVYYAKKLHPALNEMNLLLKKSLDREQDYRLTIAHSNKAIEEMSDTLQLLNATLEGNLEIMKIYYEDNKKLAERLQHHDDRSEKILTKLELVNEKIGNLEVLTRDKFEVLFKDRGIKEDE